jgi:hypothetical protein
VRRVPVQDTKEGTAAANGRSSARVISNEHDEEAGRRYGVWLGQDGILDGEK